MKKHIVVISQYFNPEPFRINDICKDLKEKGYKVTVVTGIPNYPEGKFYHGFGWLKRRKETWEGVDIIRLPLISRGHSALRLIANYYSFVISGWFWSHFTNLKADVVFSFEVSPMTQTLVGKWYSARRKIKHILYVQDLWPENLEVVGGIHNKIILNHYSRLSDKIYKQCSTILATSPSFVEAIQQRVSNKEKVKFWPQYAEDFYQPSMKKSALIPQDDRLKIVFTGNIGTAQGLEILPKVANLVDKVCFVMVGNGRYREQLMMETGALGDKFLFVDRQPAESIPDILAACDVAFVSFMNNPLFEKTIPAKLQSYMACGMPILASAGGETKRIVNESKCGICCELGDAPALAQAIKNLQVNGTANFGTNSKKYAEEHFNKQKLMLDFYKIIEE